MDEPLRIQIEPTADPDAVKITFNRRLAGLGASFRSSGDAAGNPLAAGLMSIRGVREVFLLGDFVTVRKFPDADWRSIGPAMQAKVYDVLR